MPPRVLVNDRPLLGPRTGVGQYLAGVLGAWPAEIAPPIGVLETLSRRPRTGVSPGPLVAGPLSAIGPVARTPLSELRPRSDSSVRPIRAAQRRAYAAAATAALRAVRRAGDAVWEPNHHPLVGARDASPVFTTIHDLSVLQRPEFHPPDRVRAWARALPRTLDRTSAFIAVSAATARAVEHELGVSPDCVRTIPLAGRFGELPSDWTKRDCRRALGLDPDRPLAVHLGTIEPRKNAGALLEAWRVLLDERGEDRTPDLLFVGGAGWGSGPFWESLTSHAVAGRVSCTGYVPDEAALALLVAADVVLCPSWLEGFGLPALEAMGAGTPVIVSADPALVEATAGIAPTADAADAEGWAREIGRTLEDGAHREAVVTAGRALAARRTWHDVANEHTKVFAE